MIHLSMCTIGGTFFGRRNVFVDLQGFKDLEYSEESEFLERVKSKYNVEKLDYQTYIYNRLQNDSITNNYK